MRLKPNSKSNKFSKPAHPGLIFVAFIGINIVNLVFVFAFLSLFDQNTTSLAVEKSTKTLAAKKIVRLPKTKPTPTPTPPTAPIDTPPPPTELQFSHSGVTTTVFWVGEEASADNNNIHNNSSAWVEDWLNAFGGVDNPSARNGYLPTGFTPKENPFYIALPYNDLDENGVRKSTASKCGATSSKYSWCKNSWVAVRCQGKVAYGQWEDAGPNGEDDVNYVFGNALPLNQFDTKAGLDVSPAIRDYLSLSGENKCDWTLVNFANVPDGPWKQIITSTPSYEASQ